MYFDPMYLIYVGPGLLLALLASLYVRSTFKRYSEVALTGGQSGADVAAAILRSAGIEGLKIEQVEGFMSDHYDPATRTLRLSHDVYAGRSISAAGVAAHEAGHAVQHAAGYAPMRFRQALVVPASIGSQLSYFAIILGIALHLMQLAWVGVFLFGAIVLFQLVTLPVELDASRRAEQRLVALGQVTAVESRQVHAVLRAAAFTYLASAITALLQLVYFVTRLRDADRR